MTTVTILYAGLLGLLSLVLSAASGIMRGKKNIDAGDGGDREQLHTLSRRGAAGWPCVARGVLQARREIRAARHWCRHHRTRGRDIVDLAANDLLLWQWFSLESDRHLQDSIAPRSDDGYPPANADGWLTAAAAMVIRSQFLWAIPAACQLNHAVHEAALNARSEIFNRISPP